MTSLYFASSHSYSGKTLLALALGLRYKEQGLRVGFFKPVGTQPTLVDGKEIDEDVLFVKQILGLPEPAASLCPFLLTEETLRAHLPTKGAGLSEKIQQAYQQAAQGKDLLLVGGAGQALTRGAALGLSGPEVADFLNLQVLLIGEAGSLLEVDCIAATARGFGERLAGTALNRVPPERLETVRAEVIPHLQARGLKPLGVLPHDRLLHCISVGELVQNLGAQVLCAPERLGEVVEHFRIGAMTPESALEHFRRTPNKAVITGGDRADIMLAALQTDTVCLILTGSLPPSPAVRARAEELGIPMLLVAEDTLSTVEKIEGLLSRLRVREPHKVARAKELAETCLDFARLDALAL